MNDTTGFPTSGPTLEGPWEEISAHADEFAGKWVQLTVLDWKPARRISLEEQERLLDELADTLAHVPPLAEEATTRESFYQDHD